MSQENVELVRAFFEAWNAKNTDAVVELVDADVDYFPSRKLPEARPCHGPEEVLQFMARYLEAYSRHEWAIQEVIEVGGDRFLVRVNLRVEGRDSGVKLEGDLYHCLWLRDGRFFRVEDHMTLSGALHALGLEGETLEAVGLSEQDAHADS
jgi:ketosteroid isomerase-like protein